MFPGAHAMFISLLSLVSPEWYPSDVTKRTQKLELAAGVASPYRQKMSLHRRSVHQWVVKVASLVRAERKAKNEQQVRNIGSVQMTSKGPFLEEKMLKKQHGKG